MTYTALVEAGRLSHKQFQAKEIREYLGIDRNKLFYWINTHGLVTPGLKTPTGTGSRSEFSLRNLVELATVREMTDFGLDLRAVKAIKRELDLHARHPRFGTVFDLVLGQLQKQEVSVLVMKSGRGYTVVLDISNGSAASEGKRLAGLHRLAQGEGRAIGQSRVAGFTALRINMSGIASDLLGRVR